MNLYMILEFVKFQIEIIERGGYQLPLGRNLIDILSLYSWQIEGDSNHNGTYCRGWNSRRKLQ